MTNETLHGFSNLEGVFRFQIIWEQICFILGIFGNSFVLYATTAHNAIRLDRMSIWIIQLLAVADLSNCFLVLLPTLITQYGKLCHTIVFGEAFYIVMGCYSYSFIVANIFLVNYLTTNKLVRCISPLRNLTPSKRQKVFVLTSIMLVSIIPLIWIIFGLADGSRQLNTSTQDMKYLGARDVGKLYLIWNRTSSSVIPFVMISTLSALPCLTLVIQNMALLVFAFRRSHTKINKMNLLTVICVTVMFLVSFLPEFYSQISRTTSREYREIGWALSYLSSWTNPFIYILVNQAFRDFTKSSLLCRKRTSVNPSIRFRTVRIRLSEISQSIL